MLHELFCAFSGVVFGGLFSVGHILGVIAEEVCGNHIIERIFWFGSQNEPVNAVNDVSEGNSWRVVSIENAVANSALLVHVAVVDWSDEPNFRSPEWIVPGEIGVQQE